MAITPALAALSPAGAVSCLRAVGMASAVSFVCKLGGLQLCRKLLRLRIALLASYVPRLRYPSAALGQLCRRQGLHLGLERPDQRF